MLLPKITALSTALAAMSALGADIEGVVTFHRSPDAYFFMQTASGEVWRVQREANEPRVSIGDVVSAGGYFIKGIKAPRVGLLNVGAEETKGTELQKQTYALLRSAAEAGRLNFIGNVESRDVLSGGVDVLVTDGFSGNILLKSIEGTAMMLMKQLKDGHIGSKQQNNRETGFRHYMRDHFPNIKITELNLPLGGTTEEFDEILEDFFQHHPHVHHCITFNSKAHLVGQFLLRTNRRQVQIMGYDMVPKNAECVRQGSISFLIAQHAYMQGYSCIETLFQAIVLKKEVTPVNYMPIELLTKENIDFYRRTNIG
jgi:ABC-type sugar transport system substrate-binding protein